MMNTTLPTIKEAAAPLLALAMLMGSENPYARMFGAQATLDTSIQLASFIYNINHVKTCASCAAKQKMAQWLRDQMSNDG